MAAESAKKKILVTGSNGLLGQKLVYLLRQRDDVALLATSKGENRINEKSGYVYEPLDITDRNAVEKIISSYTPDCIINTAAMTNVDACETKQDECRKINVDGVKNLVDSLSLLRPPTSDFRPLTSHFPPPTSPAILCADQPDSVEETSPCRPHPVSSRFSSIVSRALWWWRAS